MWNHIRVIAQVESVTRLVQARPFATSGVALVVGVLFGWMVLGWLVAPVQWENAGPSHLSQAYQNEWVQMAADSFALTLDVSRARERIVLLELQSVSAVERALQTSRDAEQLRIAQMQYGIGDLDNTFEFAQTKEIDAAAMEQPVDGAVGSGGTRTILSALGGIVLMVVLGTVGIIMRRKFGVRGDYQGQSVNLDNVGTSGPASSTLTDNGEMENAEVPPVARFMTTYLLGDNLYDDSFSIDDANGDFLGECGVGVGETVGVGEAKKVTAFEVWLFDKNDVRTVTKVLMSEHAFKDEALRSSLGPKGAPVLACQGDSMVLSTAKLYVTARIVDMQYGSGALPENSFFDQLTIELAAWKRDTEASMPAEKRTVTPA